MRGQFLAGPNHNKLQNNVMRWMYVWSVRSLVKIVDLKTGPRCILGRPVVGTGIYLGSKTKTASRATPTRTDSVSQSANLSVTEAASAAAASLVTPHLSGQGAKVAQLAKAKIAKADAAKCQTTRDKMLPPAAPQRVA